MSTFLTLLCLVSMTNLVKAIDLSRVRMHPNFTITTYATSMSNARSLTQSKNDPRITYIGSGVGGNTVYALIDQGTGSAPRKYDAIKGFNSPGGVEWYQGSLFVSEMNQIHRFDNIDTRFINESLTKAKASLSSQVYSNWTAHGNHHGLKGVMAIKDGLIYMPIGSPCNHPKDGSDRADCVNFGQIVTIDTSTLKVTGEVAKGHRNSVGMDFSPKTGELWFTDNGRDEWGLPGNDSARFLRPADELNRMRTNGQHFGFPNCYGSGLTWESGGNDPLFYTSSCIATDSPYTNAEWDVGAHTASLGMQFLSPTSTWPDKFQGSILIAQHGCWNCEGGNRGYQVVAVHLDSTGTRAIGQTSIADFRTYTFASNGRPVDIQNMADGSILVSDDSEGAVYRISYNGPAPVATATPTSTLTPSPTPMPTPTPTTAPPGTSTPTPTSSSSSSSSSSTGPTSPTASSSSSSSSTATQGPGTNGTGSGTGTGTGTGSNTNTAPLTSIIEIFPTFISTAIIIMCVVVA